MWCTSAQPASARRPETRWRFHLSCCPDFGVHFSDFTYDPDASLRAQLTRIGRAILAVYTDEAFIVVLRVRVGRWVEETSDVSGPTASLLSDRFAASLREWIKAAARARRLSVEDTSRVADEFLTLLTRALWQVVLGGQPMAQRELRELLDSAVGIFLKAYEAPSGSVCRDQDDAESAKVVLGRFTERSDGD